MAKIHLIENSLVNSKSIKKIPLKEAVNTIEENGKTYKCRAAYEFPVWRLDKKNLNERNYSTPLAEQIIKENKTTSGLTNHPKEEVDVGTTFAVEKNPHTRNGIFYIDAYLVGDKGELAKEIIEAGGSLGLSSSCFGELDDDGNVLLEGFLTERYADWVDNPSYEVFAQLDDEIKTEKINENYKKDKFEEGNYLGLLKKGWI